MRYFDVSILMLWLAIWVHKASLYRLDIQVCAFDENQDFGFVFILDFHNFQNSLDNESYMNLF